MGMICANCDNESNFTFRVVVTRKDRSDLHEKDNVEHWCKKCIWSELNGQST